MRRILLNLILVSSSLSGSLSWAQTLPPHPPHPGPGPGPGAGHEPPPHPGPGPGQPHPPVVLPNPQPIFLQPQYAIGTTTFGFDGMSGFSGSSGSRGTTGQSLTFLADGSQVRIDARGGDGGHGQPGQDGSDATNCWPQATSGNLLGASGGSGGRSGDGGDGGDGGSTTIYFTEIKQLKNIFIDASPGRPGQASFQTSRGGTGCLCQTSMWRTPGRRVEALPDGRVQEYLFDIIHTCQSGQGGSWGSPGQSGSMGRLGSIRVIQSATALPTDILSTPAMDLLQASKSPTTLLKNIFEQAQGATLLLAPGSLVQNIFTRFMGTRMLSVRLDWKARLPITDFSNSRVSYNLDSSGTSASVAFHGAWITSQTEVQGNSQVVTVDKAVRAEDAARLSGRIVGNLQNTTLVLTDEANVSDLIQTRIIADLDDFEGEIPASDLQINGNQISFNLAKFHKPNKVAKDLKPGKKVKAELEIIRSLGSNSKKIEIEIKQVLQ